LWGVRWATLALLATASIGVWQAWGLERWAIDGPGPGLWPMVVASVCVALSLVVLLWPGRDSATEAGDTDPLDAAEAGRTRSTFGLYCLALVVLALGSAFAGFVLTAFAVSILLVRFAEGRSWRSALTYGLAASVIGLVCFAWWLRVDLPTGPIERAFLSLVR
jgi:hypothetical protein